MMRRAFIAYVWPIIEYNFIIWNPSVKFLIDLIEGIESKFSKRIPSLSCLAYAERIVMLNLETFELRKLRFKFTFLLRVFQ